MLNGLNIRSTSALWRALLGAALALGCSDILDISEPHARPVTSASAGAASDNASTPLGVSKSGAAGVGSGGDAGMSTGGVAEGGAPMGDVPDAGSAGEPPGAAGGSGGVGGSGVSGSGGVPVGAGGAAGSTTTPLACTPGQQRCDPVSVKTPEICDGAGQWIRNVAEGNGQDCPGVCSAITGLCADCQAGDTSCKDNYALTCVNGVWAAPPQPCANFCKQGQCQYPASCADPLPTCGSDSCCVSLGVSGGDFYRSNQSAAQATVSSFTMDKYEVTQGRFSRFVNWSYGMFGMPPQAGAGKMAHNPNYAGWQANYPLPTTKQAMLDLLACDPDATYGSTNPNLPANCVNYYAAYAFCIWDGGRLPTEAEWNYAAAGGAEQRFYPWSDPPSSTLIDTSFASFADGGNVLAPVGSFTKGYALYGQADLAGNVSEWALDYFSSAYQVPCMDCIDVTYAMTQSTRGGSYTSVSQLLKTATRSAYAPDELHPYLGFRCVHDL